MEATQPISHKEEKIDLIKFKIKETQFQIASIAFVAGVIFQFTSQSLISAYIDSADLQYIEIAAFMIPISIIALTNIVRKCMHKTKQE